MKKDNKGIDTFLAESNGGDDRPKKADAKRERSSINRMDRTTLNHLTLAQKVRTNLEYLIEKGFGNVCTQLDNDEHVLYVGVSTLEPVVISDERKYYLDAKIYTNRGYRLNFDSSKFAKGVRSYTTILAQPHLAEREEAEVLLYDERIRRAYRAVNAAIGERCAELKRGLNLSSKLFLPRFREYQGHTEIYVGNTSAIKAYNDMIRFLKMAPNR